MYKARKSMDVNKYDNDPSLHSDKMYMLKSKGTMPLLLFYISVTVVYSTMRLIQHYTQIHAKK
jgi:hypothetical protein